MSFALHKAPVLMKYRYNMLVNYEGNKSANITSFSWITILIQYNILFRTMLMARCPYQLGCYKRVGIYDAVWVKISFWKRSKSWGKVAILHICLGFAFSRPDWLSRFLMAPIRLVQSCMVLPKGVLLWKSAPPNRLVFRVFCNHVIGFTTYYYTTRLPMKRNRTVDWCNTFEK